MENTNSKQQLLEKLQGASNVLVTVSANPSVDQLAACIGLTLMLNKLDKHATAVFSGDVPSTIEFLQPEETLEKTTDSLRDFIISLDKSKADKLRYKVEDKIVKIFITPYHTALSQDDLEFSLGDFNVDIVIGLGVVEQRDIDQAITAHGRILHDATVATINTTAEGGLGSINWHEPAASSLSELVAELSGGFEQKVLDEQIATALLTGIVAETNRFSNEKTSATTMKMSAELMAAGANQQLVAAKLQEELSAEQSDDKQNPDEGKSDASSPEPPIPPKPDDGTLEIGHEGAASQEAEASEPPEQPSGSSEPVDDIDDLLRKIGEPPTDEPTPAEAGEPSPGSRPLAMQPPSLGGTLSANTKPEGLDPSVDPLSLPKVEQPLLSHSAPGAPAPSSALAEPKPPELAPLTPAESPKPAASDSADSSKKEEGQTLSDIEASVHSPHVDKADVGSARDAVEEALRSGPPTGLPEASASVGALPMDLDLHPAGGTDPGASKDESIQVNIDEEGNLRQGATEQQPSPPAAAVNEPAPGEDLSPANKPLDMPLPPAFTPPPMPPAQPPADPHAPPPVPPPMMPPQFMNPGNPDQNR